MGPEKGGSKSRGFLHLFDWNRKSRKKLFSVSPESTKQKRTDDNLTGTKLRLLDEDETVVISSMKGSSDYSCASSVTDEEGNEIRAPGIVARLMGLNYMPASGFSELCSTPWHDKRSLGDKQSLKRGSEFFINDKFNSARNSTDAITRKPTEFRTQKMPSSPIERFQTETLPLRSLKAISLTHHKLLSPIKTPGFTPPQNAARIMEAAANILEPAFPFNSRAKVSSPYVPLKNSWPKNSTAASQRTSKVLELAKKPVESSDVRYLKGQSLNRSWNGSEDSSSTFRHSPDISDTYSLDGKGKGKSVSLAIQAKVNVQRREGLSINSRNASLAIKTVDEGKLNQPFKSQPNNQNNKQKKKVQLSSGPGVLRQNNQIQNCLSGKGKLTPKKSVSNQQGRKLIYRDNILCKKNITKPSESSRVINCEDNLDTTTSECEGFLSNKDYPQKKRLIEGDSNSQRNSVLDNVQVVSHQKHVLPNVLIDEHIKLCKEKRKVGSDVVSFTFTSPLVKSIPSLPSSILVEENCDKRSIYKFDSQFPKNSYASKKQSPQGLNTITGDALSLLLEQKLRELTSGDKSSYCNFEAASSTSCVPVQQALDTDSLSTGSTGHEKQFVPKACSNQQSLYFSSGMSSTDGHMFGLSYRQGLEGECSSISDVRNEPNLLQPSPVSMLEFSFSNESCNSSVSTASTKGSKISALSFWAQNTISSSSQNKFSSFETGLDLSDSTSSSSSSGATSISFERQHTHAKNPNNEDLDYVHEVLNSRRVSAADLALHPPNLLFNKSEKKRGRDGSTQRKMMFDCITECLDNRCIRFFRAGYRGWVSGESMTPKDISEEVYGEISRWKGFGDCMVDELVDRDMSSHRGRWVDFEMEAFELGGEMEREIISSFIDEFVTDCFHA